jgi:F0F1-type ATP synthase delta subunit
MGQQDKALDLVKNYFDLVTKDKKINHFIGEFDGYEFIAKGHAIIHVLNTPAFNRNQKKELVKLIKEM